MAERMLLRRDKIVGLREFSSVCSNGTESTSRGSVPYTKDMSFLLKRTGAPSQGWKFPSSISASPQLASFSRTYIPSGVGMLLRLNPTKVDPAFMTQAGFDPT